MAFDELARMVQVMPPEQKVLYEYLSTVEIPAFIDIMKLIDLSEERGQLSRDEASSLRAGRVGDIDNPIPSIERNGDEGLA